jgi:hypothetical protein
MHAQVVPVDLHPALEDVASLLVADLGGPTAARLLARAAADAAANSAENAATLAAASDPERMAALQAWNHAWPALAAEHSERFAVPPQNLSSVGAALAYALAQHETGLEDLVLSGAEREALNRARTTLRRWTGLPLEPCRPLVVTAACLPLRNYLDLALPGTTALTLGHEPLLREYVLVGAASPATWRATDASVSHLVLTLVHEELHIALVRAAARRDAVWWTALSTAGEEPVVSGLDLAAEHWLAENACPTREQLLARAPDGCYPQAVKGLLRRLPPTGEPEALPVALASLGLAVLRAAGDDDKVAAALNAACSTELTTSQWLDALPLS